MWGEKRNVYRLLIRKVERKSPLGKSRILKNQGGRMWTGFIWLRRGIMDFCEHFNEANLLSGYVISSFLRRILGKGISLFSCAQRRVRKAAKGNTYGEKLVLKETFE